MKVRVFTFLIILLLGSAFMNNLQGQSMSLVFNTNLSAGTTITLPLYGTVDVTVDWGDGASNTFTTSGDRHHSYADDGEYTVTISGTLPRFGKEQNAYTNANKLTSVTSFGELGLTSLNGAFRNSINLISVSATLPSGIWSLGQLFRNATQFNGDISGWNISSATTMYVMLAFIGRERHQHSNIR